MTLLVITDGYCDEFQSKDVLRVIVTGDYPTEVQLCADCLRDALALLEGETTDDK